LEEKLLQILLASPGEISDSCINIGIPNSQPATTVPSDPYPPLLNITSGIKKKRVKMIG